MMTYTYTYLHELINKFASSNCSIDYDSSLWSRGKKFILISNAFCVIFFMTKKKKKKRIRNSHRLSDFVEAYQHFQCFGLILFFFIFIFIFRRIQRILFILPLFNLSPFTNLAFFFSHCFSFSFSLFLQFSRKLSRFAFFLLFGLLFYLSDPLTHRTSIYLFLSITCILSPTLSLNTHISL